MTIYQTIVADPPWPYASNELRSAPDHRPNSWNTVKGGVSSVDRYGAMSMADLRALLTRESITIADNAHLYLWTTNTFLLEDDPAARIARAWGFTPKTLLTWVKIKKRPNMRAHPNGFYALTEADFSNGYESSMKAGYYYRGATEHVIFAVRGSLRLQNPAFPEPTWFGYPRLEHSRKPEPFMAMVERQSPGPYLELFARRKRDGWDSWGNQVEESPLSLFG